MIKIFRNFKEYCRKLVEIDTLKKISIRTKVPFNHVTIAYGIIKSSSFIRPDARLRTLKTSLNYAAVSHYSAGKAAAIIVKYFEQKRKR